MRCKKGELAIIIKSAAGNEGKIVRCINALGVVPWVLPDGSIQRAHGWLIDRQIPTCFGDMAPHVRDEYMCPIRPDSEPESTDTPRELEAA